jgi:hypothetical protein
MSRNGRRSVSVALDLIHFSISPDDLDRLCCLHCRSVLSLHQPDEGFSERILGVCRTCKYWFLVDLVPGKAEAVMVLLPAGDFFRTALDGRPA